MPDAVTQFLKQYPIISDQINARELTIILHACHTQLQTAPRNGSVVEFGCYVGTTSLFLQRLIQTLQPSVQLHVYDSFAGLPPKTTHDASPVGQQFRQGELLATKRQFIQHFKQAGVPLPIIHKNWFNQLVLKDIPPTIVFAFLDGDYYDSIHDSLQLIWPRLHKNAIIIVDDYQNEALPGARRAVNNWLQRHPAKLRIEASLAILYYQG